MREDNANGDKAIKVHWSFWLIGAVTLVYNLAGGVNFMMQMNPETVTTMPETLNPFIEARPFWATLGFAVAVIGGAFGCVLLLLKRGPAYPVFIASFIGAVVTLVDSFIRAAPMDAVIGNLVQLAVTAFLIGYARWAARKYQY